MKKSCYGLLLACAITFGLSLSGSSDTNALKYSYNAYPVIPKVLFVGDEYAGSIMGGNPSQTFSFSFGSSSQDLSMPDGTYQYYDTCSHYSTDTIFSLQNYNNRKIIRSSDRYLDPFAVPIQVNAPLTGGNSLQVPCQYRGLYDYDSLIGGDVNLVTGEFDKFISLSEFFSNWSSSATGDVYSFTIPLDISQDNVGILPANSPIDIDFELFSTMKFTNLDSSPEIRLLVNYYPFDTSTYTGNVFQLYNSRVTNNNQYSICTFTPNDELLKVNDDLTFVHYYAYKINCSYTPDTPMSYVFMTLQVSSSNSSQPIFHFDDFLYFGSSYLITGNDDTWSGQSANYNITGEHIDYAPGYSDAYCDNGAPGGCTGQCLDDDFLCKLSHLFDFSVLNPFAPMFDLFTDNSNCASIPIIAGMLNSSETTYCPWFSSTTRDILTPVLGLASSMLIFGFFVRWLGSSSGNLFEDSSKEEVSNQGGRWGHFKKGAN